MQKRIGESDEDFKMWSNEGSVGKERCGYMKYKKQANQHVLLRVQQMVMASTTKKSYHVRDNNYSEGKNKTK